MFQRRLFWPLFAAVMAFALGGSVGSAIPLKYVQALQHQEAKQSAAQRTDETDSPRSIWIPANPTEHFTAWVAAFTFGLFIVTGGLVWVAIVQRRDTRILQRAYLAVAPYGVDPFEELTKVDHSVAHISVRNVGHLPAREVRWFIETELSSDGRRKDFPIDETKFYGRNVIPPGTDMKRSQNCAFSDQEIRDFLGGSLVLYVWGEIRYLDGFNVQRFTRFCHRYDRRGISSSASAVWRGKAGSLLADSMRYHQFGNDAD